ncbi:MAG: pilin [bacterium]|nr:pilin [bacterium]
MRFKVFTFALSLCVLSLALFAFPSGVSAQSGQNCNEIPRGEDQDTCWEKQRAEFQQKTTDQSTPGFSFNLGSFYQPVAGKVAFQSFGGAVGFAYRVILLFAGIIAFFLLILGGVRYIISGGDAKKTEEARNMLTMAIIGFALVVLAAMIYPLLQRFLGLPKLF